MNEYVKTGIIGVGNIGSAHAASIYGGRVRGMKLCALCDSDSARLSEIRALYPDVPCFSCADELISSSEAEAVIIATPHYSHPEIAKKAFLAGMHVLTEKPAGVSCGEVRSLIRTAKESGRIFGVMFNQRTNKLFRAAKQIVSSGLLGELKRCVWIVTNWYRHQRYYDSGGWRATWRGEGGGVLINQAPHNLDIMQWICGMPESIFAKCDEGKYHAIEVEDDATVVARYKNGATAVFIASTGEFPGTNRLEISGTGGKIVIENGKLTHTLLGIDEREYCFSERENSITVTEIADEKYNGHINILENFASAIINGDELIAPGKDALNELEISNAAYLSSWMNKEITLPLDDGLYNEFLRRKIESSVKSEKNTVREDIQFEYKERWNTKW